MRGEVLELGGREAGLHGGVGEDVEGVFVDLYLASDTKLEREGIDSGGGRVTFAILARRKDRTRNLNRSSSVWSMMREKLAFGSMLPVCVSTSSIWHHSSRGLVSPALVKGLCNSLVRLTCRRILSIILSINVSGHGSSSGAARSATHARVNSWRSRVS